MEREVLFWSRFNLAVASVCQEVLLDGGGAERLVEALVGEDFEWIGACAVTNASRRMRVAEESCARLQRQCQHLQVQLSTQMEASQKLKAQMSDLKGTMNDREWLLQEKIAALEQRSQLQDSRDEPMRLRVVTPEREGSAAGEGLALSTSPGQLSTGAWPGRPSPRTPSYVPAPASPETWGLIQAPSLPLYEEATGSDWTAPELRRFR